MIDRLRKMNRQNIYNYKYNKICNTSVISILTTIYTNNNIFCPVLVAAPIMFLSSGLFKFQQAGFK